MLSGLINERFNRFLAGSRFGQSSAAQVGTGALGTGANVGNVLTNQGEAIGEGAIAKGNINKEFLAAMGKLFATQRGKQQTPPIAAPAPTF